MRINSYTAQQHFGKIIKAKMSAYKPQEYPSDWKYGGYGMASRALENVSSQTKDKNRQILAYLRANISSLSGGKPAMAIREGEYFITGDDALKIRKIRENTAKKSEDLASKRQDALNDCDDFFDELEIDCTFERKQAELKRQERELIDETIEKGLSKDNTHNVDIKVNVNGEIKEVEYYREYSDNNKKRMFKKSI